MNVSSNKTSLTFYVPLSLKLRIDHAADADQRSTSQYLVMLLEKIVPQSTKPAQIDIEEQIASTCNCTFLGGIHSNDCPKFDPAIDGATTEELAERLVHPSGEKTRKHKRVTEYGKVLKAQALAQVKTKKKAPRRAK
jgi:hypothetical protein